MTKPERTQRPVRTIMSLFSAVTVETCFFSHFCFKHCQKQVFKFRHERCTTLQVVLSRFQDCAKWVFDILQWLSGGHATFTPFQVCTAFSVLFGSVYTPTCMRTERHTGTHRHMNTLACTHGCTYLPNPQSTSCGTTCLGRAVEGSGDKQDVQRCLDSYSNDKDTHQCCLAAQRSELFLKSDLLCQGRCLQHVSRSSLLLLCACLCSENSSAVIVTVRKTYFILSVAVIHCCVLHYLKLLSHDHVSVGENFLASAGKPFNSSCLMIRCNGNCGDICLFSQVDAAHI